MYFRFFKNPYRDYRTGDNVVVEKAHVIELIKNYVHRIIKNTKPKLEDSSRRGDLYVGDGGIAYMFWKLHKSPDLHDAFPALETAKVYIDCAIKNRKKRVRVAFLSGNAGSELTVLLFA